ncbi:lipid-A-disaccharide synthase [Niabella aurantiaca]|uniref:lipid-A-disaccharide synthase n=1 Tax=Niabella aurantiaca TaxID=379900 RepID=UPI000362BF8C|nr:lipid-A-disaccharide synthase [Niabella aurantiaca]
MRHRDPRYYVIAGEASGDLHGGNLVAALKQEQPGAQIRGWGGDKMQAAGMELVKHYRDLAFMGFAEVVMNLKTILNNLRSCKEDILAFKPDVLILVDYPGFNLRIAKWAREQGIKVVYYISPQVWAWKEGRVKMMKRCIDKMLVILPFEQAYYRDRWNWTVDYVGHPLIEEIDRKKKAGSDLVIRDAAGQPVEKPVIALLPGSRKQEIEKKLPVMLAVSREFPGFQFVVAQAPAVDSSFYLQFTRQYPNVSIVNNRTYDVLLQATAALVTSGTATLETALFGIPEVVCYKGSEVSYQIAKRVISIKYISLVNLIMDKPVVKELIQGAMTAANIITELKSLLFDDQRKAVLKKDYDVLHRILAAEGDASRKAAAIITEFSASVAG